jgi:hypothetical protein
MMSRETASPEPDQPNDRKRDYHARQAEHQNIADVVPGHGLSFRDVGYHRWPLARFLLDVITRPGVVNGHIDFPGD